MGVSDYSPHLVIFIESSIDIQLKGISGRRKPEDFLFREVIEESVMYLNSVAHGKG
uniref:Uncharacterized protein n=1 Tax=Solanum tuberosum TaxID=4113 RepID=M1C8W9_SOLTU